MLVVISPAKTLDFETPAITNTATKPLMLKDSAELVDIMRGYAPDDIVNLMGVSQKIGELNSERFMNWHTPFTKKNAKQALLAFKGDVYTGLDAESFNEDDFTFAQSHLRILSGLYGVLRPLDLIQAYRLEMGTKLENGRGKNLYEFWGSQPSAALKKQLAGMKSKVLINLASNEYFNAVDKKLLDTEIITPVFKDYKNGKYKIISFYAKKARGLMSAYIIKHRIEDPAKLKKFNTAGYRFDKDSSDAKQWVFLRDEQI
ncbi:peroxide stress protein YaaA [Pseudomonadales bacterium]|nr:peroxide stress protein YaaA [Pseudomonadales bacterium]